ncbi:MAG: hypothetical protein AB7O98_09560 [Hyphomonadaceae bacterium]
MNEPIILTPEEQRARKRRNMWLALAIIGFVALVFLITLTRLQANMS